MSLQNIIQLSRHYGSNPEFVKAGGGNTSYKTEDKLYVKASGFSLADIDAAGFAVIYRAKLEAIWEKNYPENTEEREKVALADLMDTRVEGETKRPSVEALLHALLPQTYIVHTHPPLVNGLTCSKGGKAKAEEIFGTDMLWIPSVNPGYILAKTIRELLADYRQSNGKEPTIILMQNHGIFVMADAPGEIDRVYTHVFTTMKNCLNREPDLSHADADNTRKEFMKGVIGKELGESAKKILFERNGELERFIQSEASFQPLSSVYTPDHIVYCGPQALYVQDDTLIDGIEKYRNLFGREPKIIVCEDLGVFSIGTSEKAASTAMAMFLDGLQIAVYSESFTGPSFLPDEQIQFILGWEVEHYRSKVSLEED